MVEERVSKVLPLLVLLLALTLSLSPIVLLGPGKFVDGLERDDLTDSQVEALNAIAFATRPAEVNEGRPAIHLVAMEGDELILVGTWKTPFKLGPFLLDQSMGGRDVFFVRLNATGQWSTLHTFGGPGEESVRQLQARAGEWVVRGTFHGVAEVGPDTLQSEGHGPAAFEVRIDVDGLRRAWRIDMLLLPEVEAGLWCGYR